MSEENGAWSVAELTDYIQEMFAADIQLKKVEVEGEISNFTRARSGHLYFTLKDAESQLKCAMWRSSADKLRFDPQDGDAVIAHGRVTVYQRDGVYQLQVRRMKAAGQGDLARQFDLLKQQLAGAGLFDEEHKKPLPAFPQKIGIVTSADAAALQDILNVLNRRYPLVEVLIAPTLVQGTTAPPGIIRSLQWLDGRDDIDLIIVARGGGSMEDLWAFNDERVARAIFGATTPIISGVGHEVDFTIADFVADVRAPTPSAAAELAVPDVSELAPSLHGTQVYLNNLISDQLQSHHDDLSGLKRILNSLSPENQVQNKIQQVDSLHLRLDQAMKRCVDAREADLKLMQVQLDTVSPQATLARGYAIVRGGDGRIIHTVGSVVPQDKLKIQVEDGEFDVIVE